jgi:hypothetical protein
MRSVVSLNADMNNLPYSSTKVERIIEIELFHDLPLQLTYRFEFTLVAAHAAS